MKSPTAQSLAHLRKLGYHAQVVERFIRFPGMKHGIRQDLFGFGDIVAYGENEPGVMLVQATSTSNVSARIAKIRDNANAWDWLRSPARQLVIHGWAKRGCKGKRKLWTLQETVVTINDGRLRFTRDAQEVVA